LIRVRSPKPSLPSLTDSFLKLNGSLIKSLQTEYFKPYADYKVKTVQIKVGDAFQEREIQVLSSRMKQALIKRLYDNVRGLAELKKKGVKVGRIKFVKVVHLIPLMHYGVTYWVKKDNKMIHIQGVGNFKVSGLDQIPENAELSSANLVVRNGDY